MSLFRLRLCVLTLSVMVLSACELVESNGVSVVKNITGLTASKISNYREAKQIFWDKVYPQGHTIYCQKKFTRGWREGINVEHVFPMAWVKNALQCGTRDSCRQNSELFNIIEADMHNLYPSIEELNYQRQSYRFGSVGGEKREFGEACDFEVDRKKRVAEPRRLIRGDLARAMLYMEHQYHDAGLKLFNKQARLMLKWHYEDAPSEEEFRRNDIIEKYQGSRNPFIDNPQIAEDFKQRRGL